MHRLLRLLAAVVLAAGGVFVGASPAGAHNSFVASEPADGATLTVAPTTMSMRFAQAVPLDSASVQLIDTAGVRTELAGLRHGAAGDTELVVDLPALAPGVLTVRWRLVGPDGHPLTDRIVFTVAAPAVAAPGGSAPAVSAPPAVTGPTTTATGAGAADSGSDSDPASTPGPVRWLLRYASYLAIMAVIAVVLTDGFVWPGCAARPPLRSLVAGALGAVALLALAQLLVLAADLRGVSVLTAWSALDEAGRLDVGTALVVRIVLAVVALAVLRAPAGPHGDVRWSVLGLLGGGTLATWAFAGHAASQRWPQLGVTLDVVHHGAAAVWVGSLVLVGLGAARVLDGADLAPVVGRLSRVAARAVAALVVTGVVQSVRLVGGPGRLLDGAHGRYLVAKVVLLVPMLLLAAANRRRVAAVARRPETVTAGGVRMLRRSIGVEAGLGLVVVGLTAAMVVAPPAMAAAPAPPRGDAGSPTYYVV